LSVCRVLLRRISSFELLSVLVLALERKLSATWHFASIVMRAKTVVDQNLDKKQFAMTDLRG
jgi:hypothetical protein